MLSDVPVYIESNNQMPHVTPCVICGIGLSHYTHNRRIPDYLCLKCYREYEDHLDEPWLKFLMNKERSRRQKRQRLARRGIYVEEVSLDSLLEAGYNL
jgi:hypothetical protein